MDKLDSNKCKTRELIDTTFETVVTAYLEVASRGWSKATRLSESSRLTSVLPILNKCGFNVDAIYGELSPKVGAYTLKTTFIRLAKLYDFCVECEVVADKSNPFKSYMTIVAPNRFKTANVYKYKAVNSEFSEVVSRLRGIKNYTVRDTLLFMLHSGLRISEVYSITKNDNGTYSVQGKGGKLRDVMQTPPDTLASKWVVQEALAKLGLTPHELRKLSATKLAENGIGAKELQQVFGWSSITTAQIYLQNSDTDKLKKKVEEVFK